MIMASKHSGIDITADAIKAKLMDMQKDSGAVEKTGSAFVSKGSSGSSKFRKNHKEDSSGSSTAGRAGKKVGKEVVCYECKLPGHSRNKCPTLRKKFGNFADKR
ncbi:unnamed protein product [Acanthoscelides obtectus]|uniref:CCHC-type domain-containing protein n=1 Tax=Acanthoscelides obtectus TaxID=200917 RepID=A0A9P0PQ59_ACAOB|nr:unnamed protein product [Acanthoscelides obtectus]CAK1680608.1 hypothetical protein AOBTE_LOCUS32800 [Acanthoscelides obtectus]